MGFPSPPLFPSLSLCAILGPTLVERFGMALYCSVCFVGISCISRRNNKRNLRSENRREAGFIFVNEFTLLVLRKLARWHTR